MLVRIIIHVKQWPGDVYLLATRLAEIVLLGVNKHTAEYNAKTDAILVVSTDYVTGPTPIVQRAVDILTEEGASVMNLVVAAVLTVLAIKTKPAWEDVSSIIGNTTVAKNVVTIAHRDRTTQHLSVITMGTVSLAAKRHSRVRIVQVIALPSARSKTVMKHLATALKGV